MATLGATALALAIAFPARAQLGCPAGTFDCGTGCCPFGTTCGGIGGCPVGFCCGPDDGGGDDGVASGEVEVCENTCRKAFDGVCDDGASEEAICALGSDCADCGPRVLSEDAVGGCRSTGGPSLTGLVGLLVGLGLIRRRRGGLLVGLGLIRRRRGGRLVGLGLIRRRRVGLLVVTLAVAPSGASARELDRGTVADLFDRLSTPTEGGPSGSELGWGVAAGGSLGSELGLVSVGPRLRAQSLSPVGRLLLGMGGVAELGLVFGREPGGPAGAGIGSLGGRGHGQAFMTVCFPDLGEVGSCVDLGGFASLDLRHRLEPSDARTESLGLGPLLGFRPSPRVDDGGGLRGLRLELGLDATRGLVDLRLGFEL